MKDVTGSGSWTFIIPRFYPVWAGDVVKQSNYNQITLVQGEWLSKTSWNEQWQDSNL